MNKNKIIGIAVVAIVVIVGLVWYTERIGNTTEAVLADYKNATYTVEGETLTLVNGRAESTSAPGSASKTITQYFGNEATGDLNGDGLPDVAFILAQTTGGSGTFYYVVAALQSASGYQGTNAVLLGDRIAPQTTEIKNGQVIVNYADRNVGESFAVAPSRGVSKYLDVTGTVLAEAAPVSGLGERCGGNVATAPVCTTGYHCAPVAGSHLPFGDVGGTCVAN